MQPVNRHSICRLVGPVVSHTSDTGDARLLEMRTFKQTTHTLSQNSITMRGCGRGLGGTKRAGSITSWLGSCVVDVGHDAAGEVSAIVIRVLAASALRLHLALRPRDAISCVDALFGYWQQRVLTQTTWMCLSLQ